MRLNRRRFIGKAALGGAVLGGVPGGLWVGSASAEEPIGRELEADVVIAGGGLGGCAAALAALRNGLTAIMTEETDWIGGQLTQQGVPPDEHQWIESHGATQTYRQLRGGIRDYYRRHYPLTDSAREAETLNPGNGHVSRLCHEPRAALAVLEGLLMPYRSSRRLILLPAHRVIGADVSGDRVRALKVESLRGDGSRILSAPYFVDATELGDLLPLTGTEFVTGSESRKETGELHAAQEADPRNQQAFTHCFAMDFLPGENHVIERPREYDFWREFVPDLSPPWPGKLFSFTYTHPSSGEPRQLGFAPEGEGPDGLIDLFRYRRIVDRQNFRSGAYAGDMTVVNWPQNDYMIGPLVGGDGGAAREQHIERAKQLSLSLLYWLQTEAPRTDDRQGFPELRLRPDVMGTTDGLAKFPYVREARRIKALFTVLEEHVGRENRARATGQDPSKVKAKAFPDTVGVGSYHIDLHPSTGGDNYIDFPSLPFQIPLGALIPQRMENLLPAAKNIGTTHVTNGCYRLHPVEWNIGESVGCLVAEAVKRKQPPRAIYDNPDRLQAFQERIRQQGIETHWP